MGAGTEEALSWNLKCGVSVVGWSASMGSIFMASLAA